MLLVYLDTSKMEWIIHRQDLHNLDTKNKKTKKIKRAANSCKGSFGQCKKQN